MTKTTILPVDFSTNANQAIATATTLARDLNARLIILHVEELPSSYAGGDFYYGLPEPRGDELRRLLNEVQLDDAAIAVERRLVLGRPAIAIVDAAHDENADFIVMATHGRTGIMHLLMGSVAEEVVRTAPCPVIIVRATRTESRKA